MHTRYPWPAFLLGHKHPPGPGPFRPAQPLGKSSPHATSPSSVAVCCLPSNPRAARGRHLCTVLQQRLPGFSAWELRKSRHQEQLHLGLLYCSTRESAYSSTLTQDRIQFSRLSARAQRLSAIALALSLHVTCQLCTESGRGREQPYTCRSHSPGDSGNRCLPARDHLFLHNLEPPVARSGHRTTETSSSGPAVTRAWPAQI